MTSCRAWLLPPFLVIACGGFACSDPADLRFEQAARQITLRDQQTVRLDVELEQKIRTVLRRAFAFDPVLGCARVWLPFELGSIAIATAPQAAVDAWTEGKRETGIESIDNVIAEFGVVSIEALTLQFAWNFEDPLNPEKFADLVTSTHPELIATARYLGGDGDDISVERTNDGHQVRVEHGTGDCEAGCIEKHYWVVSVPDDETEPVTLIEEGGYEYSAEDLELWCNGNRAL